MESWGVGGGFVLLRLVAACCCVFWPGGVGGCGGSYRPGPGRLIRLIEAIAAYCGLLRWGGGTVPARSEYLLAGRGGGRGRVGTASSSSTSAREED